VVSSGSGGIRGAHVITWWAGQHVHAIAIMAGQTITGFFNVGVWSIFFLIDGFAQTRGGADITSGT